MASPPTPSAGFWQSVKEYILLPIDKTVVSTIPEVGHLAPIILSLGTLFIASVTLNYPLAIFGASSIEAGLLYNVFEMLGDYIQPPTVPTTSTSPSCQTSFQTLTSSRFKQFLDKGLKDTFPNSPLYYISFAAAYCIQSMYFFSKECSELGPQYSNRPYLAILGATMFLLLYSVYLLAYGCASSLTIGMTILLGLLVGYLICYQNFLLLGKPAVNLLFIPPLARRSGLDYVCVTTK